MISGKELQERTKKARENLLVETIARIESRVAQAADGGFTSERYAVPDSVWEGVITYLDSLEDIDWERQISGNSPTHTVVVLTW